MKKLVYLFVSLFLVALATENVSGQTNATASAITNATIITPLSITKTQDLNFGNIVAGSAGAVIVNPEGARTSTGGVTLPTVTPGTITAANFTIEGLAAATYSIQVPPSFNVTRASGTETMTVYTFVTNPNSTGTLGSDGTELLKVGASLAVGANQTAGTYTNANALTITVAYN